MNRKVIRPTTERLAAGAIGVLGAALAWAADAPSLVAVLAGFGVYATIWAAVGTVQAVRPLVIRR